MQSSLAIVSFQVELFKENFFLFPENKNESKQVVYGFHQRGVFSKLLSFSQFSFV